MVTKLDILKKITEVKNLLGGIKRDSLFDTRVAEEIMSMKNFSTMTLKDINSSIFEIIDDEVSNNLDKEEKIYN